MVIITINHNYINAKLVEKARLEKECTKNKLVYGIKYKPKIRLGCSFQDCNCIIIFKIVNLIIGGKKKNITENSVDNLIGL